MPRESVMNPGARRSLIARQKPSQYTIWRAGRATRPLRREGYTAAKRTNGRMDKCPPARLSVARRSAPSPNRKEAQRAVVSAFIALRRIAASGAPALVTRPRHDEAVFRHA